MQAATIDTIKNFFLNLLARKGAVATIVMVIQIILIIAEQMNIPTAAISFGILFLLNAYGNSYGAEINALNKDNENQKQIYAAKELEWKEERQILTDVIVLVKNGISYDMAVDKVTEVSKTEIIPFLTKLKNKAIASVPSMVSPFVPTTPVNPITALPQQLQPLATAAVDVVKSVINNVIAPTTDTKPVEPKVLNTPTP